MKYMLLRHFVVFLFVSSNEEEERRHHFTWKWCVCVTVARREGYKYTANEKYGVAYLPKPRNFEWDRMVIMFVHFTIQKTFLVRSMFSGLCLHVAKWMALVSTRGYCKAVQIQTIHQPFNASYCSISDFVRTWIEIRNRKKYVWSSRKKIINKYGKQVKMVKLVLLSWKMREKIIIRKGSLCVRMRYAYLPTVRRIFFFQIHTPNAK